MNPPRSSALLIVLSAPSGGGKTTLCQQLLATRPDLARAVTCTTRPPRAGEREGVDYYFLDPQNFARQVEAGLFLEHATVFGHSYGTRKAEVFEKLRSGTDVILNIDVQGAATLRGKALQEPELRAALVSVFLAPPSMATLAERLRRRGLDAPAAIEKRLKVARQEIAHINSFDYVIISSTIPEDLGRMQAIIEAEKMRLARVRLPPYSAPE